MSPATEKQLHDAVWKHLKAEGYSKIRIHTDDIFAAPLGAIYGYATVVADGETMLATAKMPYEEDTFENVTLILSNPLVP